MRTLLRKIWRRTWEFMPAAAIGAHFMILPYLLVVLGIFEGTATESIKGTVWELVLCGLPGLTFIGILTIGYFITKYTLEPHGF